MNTRRYTDQGPLTPSEVSAQIDDQDIVTAQQFLHDVLHDQDILTAQRNALREALELIAAHTSNCIEQCRAENNASLLRVHATVVSVQIMARKALAIADGAE